MERKKSQKKGCQDGYKAHSEHLHGITGSQAEKELLLLRGGGVSFLGEEMCLAKPLLQCGLQWGTILPGCEIRGSGHSPVTAPQ